MPRQTRGGYAPYSYRGETAKGNNYKGGWLPFGIGANITSKANTLNTIEANKEQAKYAFDQNRLDRDQQNQWNLDQWNRANEYNSPQSQMDRYKEAGLNPNLMYGQGNSGNAGAVPASETSKYQAPRADYRVTPSNPLSAIGMYQDIRMKKAQTDNIQEQVYTGQLENQLRSGLLGSQIQTALNKAKLSGNRAEIARIEKLEKQFSWYNDISSQKMLSELSRTQAQEARATAEAGIKKQHRAWAEQGLSPTDSLWMRQLAKRGQSVVDWFKKNKDTDVRNFLYK